MLIGIDGGGTKNDLLLFDKNGHVLRRMIAAGGSVSELGAQEVCRRLIAQLEELLTDMNGLNTPIDALFAGLSGGGSIKMRESITAALRDALPNARSVRSAGDTLTALYAGLGTLDGMAVIAGTGSSLFVRHNGQMSTVGGWGHLIDDAGSGFFLGREALNAAFRHLDGRGMETLLTELCTRQMQNDIRLCIPQLYREGKPAIAAFAPVVFEAAAAGDAAAQNILSWAADELALLIRTGARLLDAAPYCVSLTGSLWKSELLTEAVRSRLSADYELFRPDAPAVLGSALCAAEDAALPVMTVRKKLIEELQKGSFIC